MSNVLGATGAVANVRSPKGDFAAPAEWAEHESVWLAWPSAADLWEENLAPAQNEFTALCRAIADVDPATGSARGERLHVLAHATEARAAAETALRGLPVSFHTIPFGDIWLRDTAPVFVRSRQTSEIAPLSFRFNGWGGKYELPYDADVSRAVATAHASAHEGPVLASDFILEGGSVEFDGEGTCLTSRQCLLNENRNPGLSQAEIEAELTRAFAIEKTLWVGDGLMNDHTDGHIDTIARFVAPGVVVCMEPSGADDPNRAILHRIASDLAAMTDARGRKLRVERVPSPGLVLDEEGEIMPASYVNFYISNTAVIVPTYGVAHDAAAVEAIARLFPSRKTVGLSARAILSGGGAFHCITQQVPASGAGVRSKGVRA